MIYEKLSELFRSSIKENWTNELFNLISELGVEQSLLAMVESKAESLENAFIQSNYSNEWRNKYDKEKFAYIDPTVKHCFNNSLPLFWNDSLFQAKDTKEFYEEARIYGLHSGVIFPIHGPAGEFGMISFVSTSLFSEKHKKELENIFPLLYIIRDFALEGAKRFELLSNNTIEIPSLTPKESEVLKWSMAGKTAWEVSKILNCSVSTVNFHNSNIKTKFKVNSKHQAILKAIRLKIIQP